MSKETIPSHLIHKDTIRFLVRRVETITTDFQERHPECHGLIRRIGIEIIGDIWKLQEHPERSEAKKAQEMYV